jgi:hypothetical protein
LCRQAFASKSVNPRPLRRESAFSRSISFIAFLPILALLVNVAALVGPGASGGLVEDLRGGSA